MIPVVMPTYARTDIAFERGEGAYLYSTDGRRFLDFGAGVAVSALGHAHPKMIKALTDQASKIWHCSNIYRVPGQEALAAKLVAATFADTVLFCNSGAEAVECGLKMVRKYHDETGNPDRYRVICCNNAFHGRTLATIAAGGQEKLLKGFYPTVDGFDHVPFGNLNEARAAITDKTAAILVEPLQGEGGINLAAADFLQGLRKACDEFGLLLMFDEIQTGMGRTGKLFAHEWSGVTPDVMAVAKGLGGGFPVGACLATERAAIGMTAGTHGTTYGGNPLAMAVAGAVFDEIAQPAFLAHVRAMGDSLMAALKDLAARHPKVIEEVRGRGLMLGLRCRVENAKFIRACLDRGLLLIPAADNVARILPPLIIEQAQIDEAIGILDAVAADPAWEAA